MENLVVSSNVEKYEDVYRSGYDKLYPTLDLVRLEAWYLKKQPGRVLDFACGTGVNMMHMLRSGHSVAGVDAAQESIKLVQKKLDASPDFANKAVLKHLSSQDTKLPFQDNEFDYVVCMSVLSLLESKKRIATLIHEFLRVLKPGGRMIVDINGPESEFSKNGRFLNEDTFEYTLRKNHNEPLICYCPKSKEAFAKLFDKFIVDELGHTSFSYCGHDSYEFIACVRKPE